MKITAPAALASLALLTLSATAADPVDFKKQIRPILEANCLKCHGPEKPKGGLSLVSRVDALKGGDDGASLVPGDPAKSPLYTSTTLPPDHDDVMPPKGDKLTPKQQGLLKDWIQQGAAWPAELKLVAREKVDFVKQVKPIIEVYCVSCHKEGYAKGDLRMDVKSEFLKSKAVVPGDAQSSKVYTTTVLPEDHDDLMPPKKKGGPLPTVRTDFLRDWIDQGCEWPEDMVLTQKEPTSTMTRDEKAVLMAIHDKIVRTAAASAGEMKRYKENIEGTEVTFEMLPIPAGEFVIGSPASEKDRKPDEGPAKKIRIEPFWMGKTEVTWNEYEVFMFPSLEKGTNVSTERIDRELYLALPDPLPGKNGNPYAGVEADAVSRPTTPYVEMSFGMGKDGYPAISMTHYSALGYCRWLTAKTGHFYRLPTEAEWEYACRAGTTTRYSWGDDESKMGDYAWYVENTDGKYRKVGKKKPNPWGLHDMHGNVAEWVFDAYLPDAYSKLGPDLPWIPGVSEYPHVARGGGWDDDPPALRSAARKASEPSWKMRDPQLPKSKFYLTDATSLGLRVVRPQKVPTYDEMVRYWTSFPAPKK